MWFARWRRSHPHVDGAIAGAIPLPIGDISLLHGNSSGQGALHKDAKEIVPLVAATTLVGKMVAFLG